MCGCAGRVLAFAIYQPGHTISQAARVDAAAVRLLSVGAAQAVDESGHWETFLAPFIYSSSAWNCSQSWGSNQVET